MYSVAPHWPAWSETKRSDGTERSTTVKKSTVSRTSVATDAFAATCWIVRANRTCRGMSPASGYWP